MTYSKPEINEVGKANEVIQGKPGGAMEAPLTNDVAYELDE